jgi:hypothetical protein
MMQLSCEKTWTEKMKTVLAIRLPDDAVLDMDRKKEKALEQQFELYSGKS